MFQTDLEPIEEAQIVTLPVNSSLDEIEEEIGLQTAPPILGGNNGDDPYHPPHVYDIFGRTQPLTAASGSFPHSPEDESPTSGRVTRSPSRNHAHHHFWRSPGGRRYPSGQPDEDREQSESLWHRSSEEEETDMPPQGGIRLVPSSGRL